jgi:hypothetical protein
LEDLEQLTDFLLLEFQRILFAENVVHTVAVCLDSILLPHIVLGRRTQR